MKKTEFLLLALLSLILLGFDKSKMDNLAPVEVERFAEENYEVFIFDIVNDSNAAAFNFTKGDQNLKLGRLIPENRLVIDKYLNITVEAPSQWVVPVYQSGKLKNAFDIYNSSKDEIGIAGIGYSGGFTRVIASLKEDEYFLNNEQYNLGFAYSPSKNRVRPLNDGLIRLYEENELDTNGITKTEFVAFLKQQLKNKYPDRFDDEESQKGFPYFFEGSAVLFLLVAYYLLKRHKRSMNG